MFTVRAAVLLAVALFLAACASPYTPNTDRPFEPITEFTTKATVSLVNTQTSTEEHKLMGGFNGITANYKTWTDVAIEIAARELKSRGATLAAGSGKTIQMAVTSARYHIGWVMIETQVDMRVETGDGYVATYAGKNSSVMGAIPKRQMDGCMMRVVVEMLNDPKIVEYLTR